MRQVIAAWLGSRLFWGVASVLALTLVFAAYLQPDLMVELATFVRSCF